MDKDSNWFLLKKWLTILYAKPGYGEITEISEYSFEEITRTVFWFEADSDRAGHVTPFNTILLNQKKAEDEPQIAMDYIFLHEVGHKRVPAPLRIVFYILMIPTGLVLIFGGAALLGTSIGILVGTGSIEQTLTYASPSLPGFLIFLAVFILISWTDEGYAELYAIKRLGRQDYEDIREQYLDTSKKGVVGKVLHRIRYPPTRIPLWLSKKL